MQVASDIFSWSPNDEHTDVYVRICTRDMSYLRARERVMPPPISHTCLMMQIVCFENIYYYNKSVWCPFLLHFHVWVSSHLCVISCLFWFLIFINIFYCYPSIEKKLHCYRIHYIQKMCFHCVYTVKLRCMCKVSYSIF